MQGYYSLIQYMPDHGRDESMNVGLLLFSEDSEPRIIQVQTLSAEELDRVCQCFPRAELTPDQVFWMANNVRQYLMADPVPTRVNLERYISTRMNQMQITPLRSVVIDDPGDTFRKLFTELVSTEATP